VTDTMPGRHDEDISLAPLDHNFFLLRHMSPLMAPQADVEGKHKLG
jgi:hypothetical protein